MFSPEGNIVYFRQMFWRILTTWHFKNGWHFSILCQNHILETWINSHQRNGKKCVWNLCLLACKNVSLILRHQRHVLNKRVLDEESSHTRCESGHQMRLVVLGQTTIWSKFVASHAVFVQQILIYDFYICNKNLWQGELIVPTDAWMHQPICT